MEHLLEQTFQGFSPLLLLAIIALCILALSWGAECMIDGVVHLARRTGVPRIVIGATIISLGTTLPEAFVSVMAAWVGNPGLALGNGVGSIIADTGLVLGAACLIKPVPFNHYILNRTGWIQTGSATLLVIIAIGLLFFNQEPVLSRQIGFFLLALLLAYLFLNYYWARTGGLNAAAGEITHSCALHSIALCCLKIIIGLFLVVAAARFLVPSAAVLAMQIGVPQDIIAATMVAFGTSVPELTTGIVSVRKGHPEIMMGNIVGADVLNCLFVIGASAAARPLDIPDNFYLFHFPALLIIIFSFRLFIMFDQDGWMSRWQGGWLLGIYVLYILLQYAWNLQMPA